MLTHPDDGNQPRAGNDAADEPPKPMNPDNYIPDNILRSAKLEIIKGKPLAWLRSFRVDQDVDCSLWPSLDILIKEKEDAEAKARHAELIAAIKEVALRKGNDETGVEDGIKNARATTAASSQQGSKVEPTFAVPALELKPETLNQAEPLSPQERDAVSEFLKTVADQIEKLHAIMPNDGPEFLRGSVPVMRGAVARLEFLWPQAKLTKLRETLAEYDGITPWGNYDNSHIFRVSFEHGGRRFEDCIVHLLEKFAAEVKPHLIDVAKAAPDAKTSDDNTRTDCAIRCVGAIWEIHFCGDNTTVDDSIGMCFIAMLANTRDGEWYPLELRSGRRNSEAGAERAIAEGLQIAEQPSPDDPQTDPQFAAALIAQEAELQRAYEVAKDDIEKNEAAEELQRLQEAKKSRQGLSGRSRLEGHAERARQAVRKNIATALRAVEGKHRKIGQALRDRLRLGVPLSFNPQKDESWVVKLPPTLMTRRGK